MLSNSEIGLRISSAREIRGLTLDDIATAVGVARSTIQRYEKGTITKIKLPVLQSIAHALGVNPNWLIGNTDDPSFVPPAAPAVVLAEDETKLLTDYRSMNPEGKTAALAAVRGLAASGIYKKRDDPSRILGGGA